MNIKRIITLLVSVPLLSMVFFSFAFTLHEPDGNMGGCPFSAIEASPCPQDALAVAMHHLSTYQSLFGVPAADAGVWAFLVALLFAISAALLFAADPPVTDPPASGRYFYDPSSPALRGGKMLRWLSLFENSPSAA